MQDNAHAQCGCNGCAVHVCEFELVDHPHDNLVWHHLTFLFTNMKKKNIGGKQYQTEDEVISAVEYFFEDQDESFNLYHGNPSAASPMAEVCVQQGRVC